MFAARRDINIYEAGDHADALLRRLNALRNQKKYCDVILCTQSGKIEAHRNVLAAISQEMNTMMESETATVDLTQFDPQSIRLLVDYAYTGRIDGTAMNLPSLARVAKFLKAGDVFDACVKAIGDTLNGQSCLSVRRLGSELGIWKLVGGVDDFIAGANDEEREEIMESSDFVNLPRVRIDVIGDRKLGDSKKLFERVVDRMEGAYAGKIVLLQETGCRFQFDSDDETDDLSHDVTPSGTPDRPKGSGVNRSSVKTPARKLLLPHACQRDDLLDWKVLALFPVTEDHVSTGLVVLDSQLAVLSIIRHDHIRASLPRNSTGSMSSCSQELIGSLHTARSGMGACSNSGKIYAVGGYNRSKCLSSVESYSIETNEWALEASMSAERARCGAVSVGGNLYAFGGSDGQNVLTSAERYNAVTAQWTPVASLKCGRSRLAGVALGSSLYAIGGLNDKSSSALKVVEKYDMQRDVWTVAPSLLRERVEAGAAVLDGKIYVVGGSNGWSCLSSVECYDPYVGSWQYVAPLQVGRRGAGVAAFDGKLYVAGGHDSVRSLSSVEVFDPVEDKWVFGASMSCPRSSGPLAELDGALYAMGGFNGSTFLNTVEYYLPDEDRWHQLVTY
eukprot:m.307359 g.307359  ORF g.307359 m.307359 type:complete len:617 (+) comp42188_c0_seq1:550-2400(+)